jgi:hypothetical protein
MHEAEPYGHLRLNGRDISNDALARMIGSSLKDLQRYLDELEAAGVFSRTESGTIFSRRMVKDEGIRIKRAEGGCRSLQHPAVPRKKDGVKDILRDTLPPSMGESIGGSPSSSSSSSSSEKNRHTSPTAVDREFEEFWKSYPTRNGKRVGKPDAWERWKRLSAEDRVQVLMAVRHYASSKLVTEGIGIKDPHRWLRNGKGSEPWRDWIEPEQPSSTNGHQPLTCTKRIQQPGDRFLRLCAQPADPMSSPNEPRCSGHLKMETKGHALH